MLHVCMYTPVNSISDNWNDNLQSLNEEKNEAQIISQNVIFMEHRIYYLTGTHVLDFTIIVQSQAVTLFV